MFTLDPRIESFIEEGYNTPLVQQVWHKYFWPKAPKKETHINDVFRRVAKAIANSPCEDKPAEAEDIFYNMMAKKLWLPGGRILAGAGTDKRVTLMNCFVNRTVEDSMEGIGNALMDLRLTMQQGGGVGTSFETIRPANAVLQRTQSKASGVLPFMDEFNSTSRTIMSAGDRSGAMMGTLSDTHPDLPEYIRAKAEGAKFQDDDGTSRSLPYHMRRWSQFNVSVLVSDALMAAAEEDAEWLLYFHVPFIGFDEKNDTTFVDDNGITQYVYKRMQARELWNLITEYTYEYSDPGVIFIDRVNSLNNLAYCELIRCTNPCGEQPLPPNGTCNLGALNLAQFVIDPFTPDARIDYDLIEAIAYHGVRFLDNVIEVTGYPLESQRQEEYNKRRLGQGITGFGTMLAELQVPYGSLRSIQIAEKVMRTIAIASYRASINLARTRGVFPLFDAEQMLNQPEAFICTQMPMEIQQDVEKYGLRNGVLLTIAPVGTGSIAIGNPTSGLEPEFAHEMDRMVRNGSGDTFTKYTERSYSSRFYTYCTGDTSIPAYMNTAQDLTVEEHIQVQAAFQRWIDASVSKTINVPTEITREEFNNVYRLAYDSGCKGCTTYRPTADRMSILATKSDKDETKTSGVPTRGEVLKGSTYKIKWPSMSASMYVTINYMDGRPHEIFFSSKDAKYAEWMTALTLMISAIMRLDVNPSFIPKELRQVISTHDTGWHEGKFVGSLVARIAQVIELDFISNGIMEEDPSKGINASVGVSLIAGNKEAKTGTLGASCPSCGQPTLLRIEGCKKCTSCGYSAC